MVWGCLGPGLAFGGGSVCVEFAGNEKELVAKGAECAKGWGPRRVPRLG